MKIRNIIILFLAAAFLFSCGEEKGGLFYSLEQESDITNGDLADNITIGALIRNNDYYFLAAGKFLYKSVDPDVDWPAPEDDVNQNPIGYEDYLCYDFALVGDDLYSVFYAQNTATSSLLFADTSNPSNGLSWSDPLSFTEIPETESIIAVENIQGRFFVYTSTADNKYNLYSTASAGISDGSSFAVIASDMSTGGELSIDFDGTEFWIAVGSKVYTSNSTNTLTTDITSTIMSKSAFLIGDGFSGILCADTDGDSTMEVYLASEEGVMLKYSDSAWEVLANQYDTDEGLFTPLKSLTHIVISSENIDIILAGSEEGYYEMEASTSVADKEFFLPTKTDSNLATKTQFDSIDLSNNIVDGFYLDDTTGEEVVFALCYNGGLWKNTLQDDNSGRFWDIE